MVPNASSTPAPIISTLPARSLCIAIHDVSPATWAQSEYLLDALREVAPFPATLLVVPSYHRGTPAIADPGFCARMSACMAQGDELALHGYLHLDDQPIKGAIDRIRRHVYTAGEGEFSSLSEELAMKRLGLGIRWFESQGWPVQGFVAPAWLMSPGVWRALQALPFRYTTTLRRIYALPSKESMSAPSLVYSVRGAWRRAVSRRWVGALAKAQRNAPFLRFGLHPADAAYPEVVRHWQDLFAAAMVDRVPVTKAMVAENMHQMMNTAARPTNAPQAAPASTSLG
jgi:predicted deacetylase